MPLAQLFPWHVQQPDVRLGKAWKQPSIEGSSKQKAVLQQLMKHLLQLVAHLQRLEAKQEPGFQGQMIHVVVVVQALQVV